MMTMVHHTMFRHMKKNENCHWYMFDGQTAIKKFIQNHVLVHDFAVELSLIIAYCSILHFTVK